MEENIKHTNAGIASIVLGILGLVTIMHWFGLMIWVFMPLPFGISAIITSRIAKKQGDNYGKSGMILGIIATVVGLTEVIALIVYFYVSSMV